MMYIPNLNILLLKVQKYLVAYISNEKENITVKNIFVEQKYLGNGDLVLLC